MMPPQLALTDRSAFMDAFNKACSGVGITLPSTAPTTFADYKAKPLPSGHRETQTAGFGKKGLSLHGVTALRWDERRGDFAVLNVRVTCDDSEQTWFHTLSALRTTMDQLTDTWKTLSGAAPVTAPLPLQ